MSKVPVVRDFPAENRIYFNNNQSTYIEKDVINNLTFSDPVIGVKTLSELSNVFLPNTITVGTSGCDYTSIQDAINAATSTDLIEIFPATYTEDLTLNKALTIRGRGIQTMIVGKHTFNPTTELLVSISFCNFISIDEECFNCIPTHDDSYLKIQYSVFNSTYTTIALPDTTSAKEIISINRGKLTIENCTLSIESTNDNTTAHSTACYYLYGAGDIEFESFKNNITITANDVNQYLSHIHTINSNNRYRCNASQDNIYFMTTAGVISTAPSQAVNGTYASNNLKLTSCNYSAPGTAAYNVRNFRFATGSCSAKFIITNCSSLNGFQIHQVVIDLTGSTGPLINDCYQNTSSSPVLAGSAAGNVVYKIYNILGNEYSSGEQFTNTLNINDSNTKIEEVTSDMTFTDANVGSKTLSELADKRTFVNYELPLSGITDTELYFVGNTDVVSTGETTNYTTAFSAHSEKVYIIVNTLTGSGTITITGTSLDPDSMVPTTSDTETITIDTGGGQEYKSDKTWNLVSLIDIGGMTINYDVGHICYVTGIGRNFTLDKYRICLRSQGVVCDIRYTMYKIKDDGDKKMSIQIIEDRAIESDTTAANGTYDLIRTGADDRTDIIGAAPRIFENNNNFYFRATDLTSYWTSQGDALRNTFTNDSSTSEGLQVYIQGYPTGGQSNIDSIQMMNEYLI